MELPERHCLKVVLYEHPIEEGAVKDFFHWGDNHSHAGQMNDHIEPGSAVAWFYVVVHLAGMTVIVPPVEEIFYRSFLYRVFVKNDFQAMPLGQFHGLSFVVTSTIFGLMHPQWWVAGIICGLAYQWLVIRKNRLGDAMTAHAITNCLLGLWVLWKGAWSFW